MGTNGIGKSTALKVLSGKLKPNLGRFDVGDCTKMCMPTAESAQCICSYVSPGSMCL